VRNEHTAIRLEMTGNASWARLDVGGIVRFHREHGRKATVAAVPGRFAALDLAGDGNVQSFRERPDDEIGWINGGFFVCERPVLDYIEGDATGWERAPLERLARARRVDGLSTHGILAADGYFARKAGARGIVGRRQRALENMVVPTPAPVASTRVPLGSMQ